MSVYYYDASNYIRIIEDLVGDHCADHSTPDPEHCSVCEGVEVVKAWKEG